MIWIKLALLAFLVHTANALSKSKIKHGQEVLLYNIEADCFVVGQALSSHVHSAFSCETTIGLQHDSQRWYFSPIGAEGNITYDSELKVRWPQDEKIKRYLHVHYGDHGKFDYSNYRTSYLNNNAFLGTTIHEMSIMFTPHENYIDRWKIIRVESDLSVVNVETLTKVRFKHAKTNANHYLVVPLDPSASVLPVYGWMGDEVKHIFEKFSKHTDFMLLDPSVYARSLSYSLDSSNVKFSWKLNNFNNSACSVKLNVGSLTFDVEQPSESHNEIIPYSRIAGQNLGDAEWYISCNGEKDHVTIKSGRLNLPRVTNIRLESAIPLLVGDSVIFQWDVVGNGSLSAVPGVVYCNKTEIAKIDDVLLSSRKGSVQVLLPQFCAGGDLFFISDAGFTTFEVANVQLEALSYSIDYLNSKLSVNWKMNFGKAGNRAALYEISVKVFEAEKVANATNNGLVMDLESISSTGTSSLSITKTNVAYDYNWPTAKLGGVRRVSLESKSSFFVGNESAIVTIKSVAPFIASSSVKCGSTVLKTISETESYIPCCQVEVPVASCHLKQLTIDVEGIKTELLQDKLIVLPTIWHIENLKGDLQGKYLKLTWTKPSFCRDIDVVLVKSNLDDKEWNICSASETIVDFTTKFGSEKELIFIRPGVTFAVKHVLPTSIAITWNELDDEKGNFPWILVIICSGAGGLLLIIVGLISWHCYRVRKRKRQAALLRAFGNGKLHIFHIGKFK